MGALGPPGADAESRGYLYRVGQTSAARHRTGTLLDELRDFSGDGTAAELRRDTLGVSITGPAREAVQEVIDSLVQVS